MNTNNFVSGIQTVFNEFFNKYIEQKMNPIYNNLDAHPEQLFNFIEHMSNFNNSNNMQNQFSKTKDITNQNITQGNTIKNEEVSKQEIKLDELKPTKLEELQKIINKEQENIENVENEEFNIYTNLNTVDKHIKKIGNKTTFNNSGSNKEKNYWDLREHPFNLLTEQEQKENLIWSFEKFNKKEKVVPYNLDLDNENLMNYTEGIPENCNTIEDDIKISSMEMKNNKINLCGITDCEELEKEDIDKLIKWKEDLTKIKNEEIINTTNENKIQEEPIEKNDNFGICFISKPSPETLFKYEQDTNKAYFLLKLQRDNHDAELNGRNVDSDDYDDDNDEVNNNDNNDNIDDNDVIDNNNLHFDKEIVQNIVKIISDLENPENSDDINDYVEGSDTDTADTDTSDTDTSDTQTIAEELVDSKIEEQEDKEDYNKHKSIEDFLDSLDKELINYSKKSKINIV